MPLRRRISIAAAAAAALAMLVAVFACYMILRSQLRDQVDGELRNQAQELAHSDLTFGSPELAALAPAKGGAAEYAQVVTFGSSSQILAYIDGVKQSRGQTVLPVTRQTYAVATGRADSTMSTVTVNGGALRMYTFSVPMTLDLNGTQLSVQASIELARPLSSVNDVLATMRLILVLLLLLGIFLAGLLGRVASRRVLTPITEVADTAQLIGETDDLSRRIHVTEDDEVGQMAMRFNEMLERLQVSRNALDASVTAQRQLVADASHELRTPVTSLRTNIEVLLEGAVLDEDDRQRLLADVVEQCEELTALVSDLIEVARGDLPEDSLEDVRLDLLVEEALQRARRNNPNVEFVADLRPVALAGHSERLTRAINNLLDNAAKHNSPGRPVEVTVTPSALAVRDHGDGVDPADLPYLFDRFYRGINSRSRQGSGLGLAIVRQVAEQHGGSAMVANAATGGAIFTLRLPGVAVANAGRSHLDHPGSEHFLKDHELDTSIFLDEDELLAEQLAKPAPAAPGSAVSDDPAVPGDLEPPAE